MLSCERSSPTLRIAIFCEIAPANFLNYLFHTSRAPTDRTLRQLIHRTDTPRHFAESVLGVIPKSNTAESGRTLPFSVSQWMLPFSAASTNMLKLKHKSSPKTGRRMSTRTACLESLKALRSGSRVQERLARSRMCRLQTPAISRKSMGAAQHNSGLRAEGFSAFFIWKTRQNDTCTL